MVTRPGKLLDKTFTSFTEATGRLADTLVWVTKAKALAHEFEPGCRAEVTLHLLEEVLEKAGRELDRASTELAMEVFGE
jgi:hypothetical protein